jgi:hypothetical protein
LTIAKHVSEAVDLLLAPLTGEEAQLVDLVGRHFVASAEWPVYDFVEGTLERNNVDAAKVLRELPSWSYSSMGRYSLAWCGDYGAGLWVPNRDDRVALTVAGIAHTGEASLLVSSFLDLLRSCADEYAGALLVPSLPRECLQSEVELCAVLAERWTSRGAAQALAMIEKLLDREPINWLRPHQAEVWRVDWQVGTFRGVTDASDYLTRLAAAILPPPRQPEPDFASSLSLPESVDFLDTVWRLRFGSRLFGLPGATKTSALALSCATSEEFDARMSAVSDLLKRMNVPEPTLPRGDWAKLGSLQRFGVFLADRLGQDLSSGTIADALSVLRAANEIRVGRQHRGADAREAEGFAALGLGYPPANWGTAWERINMQLVAALNTIRDELQSEDANGAG